MQLDIEAFRVPCAPRPRWGRARPLAVHSPDVLSSEDEAWQLEQLAKARNTIKDIQSASERWTGDVVCLSYDDLGTDKSCSIHVKLLFLPGGKCRIMERIQNFPMGLFPFAAILAPPDHLTKLPYVNLLSNIHKFYQNDGLINFRCKLPFLAEVDTLMSWVNFDLVDEPEGGFLGIAEPLPKDISQFRGRPIPALAASRVRVYKESPEDMVVGLYKPSLRHGRFDSIRCGEVALPFPRWLLPTTLLKLVVKTVLTFILNEIGDKLILGAAGDIPANLEPLSRVASDWENYFGILRARMIHAETKLGQPAMEGNSSP